MQRFLIIQTAFLGDVVLATAVAEKLHEYYPQAVIDMLVRGGNESLLAGHPFLRKVRVWEKRRNKLRNLLQLCFEIRKERYTHVINLHRFASSGIITAFSGASWRAGFEKNPLAAVFTAKRPHVIAQKDEPVIHEVARNHSLIAALTDDKPAMPRLYPSEEDYAAVQPYIRQPYYTVSPASVWFTKQYPQQQWAKLILLLAPELPVYILGAPSDTTLAAEIISLAGARNNVISLCGRLSLLQSAALMQSAAMNWTNDSAPLHLCSAMNAQITAIFCSTVPRFGFGPLGGCAKTAGVENLYCRPCGLHGYKACPEGHFRCALDLAPETLLP